MTAPIASDGIWNIWWNPADRCLAIGNSKCFTSIVLDERQATDVAQALLGERELPAIRLGTWRHVVLEHFIQNYDTYLCDDDLPSCGYPGHHSKVRHSLVLDGWLEKAGTTRNGNGRKMNAWRLTNKAGATINALT